MVSGHNMRKKVPKVTVLMPVYNGENYLREAIDSILNQSFKEFEFLIINDRSTDNSLQIIEAYRDPRIRLFNNKTNLKLVATLNKGLNLARGEYVARMDADDISLPGRLKAQVKFLDTHPEVGILGTNVELIDDSGGYFTNFKAQPQPSDPALVRWTLFYRCCINHPTVMVRKSVYKHIGGYRSQFLYAEDYDLWLRAVQRTKIANLQKVLVKVRKHENNITIKYNREHHQSAAAAVQKSILEFIGSEVTFKTVRSLRDKSSIASRAEIFDVIGLILRLYGEFVKKVELSSSERMKIHINAFSMIGRTCVSCWKRNTASLFQIIKIVSKIKPVLFFYIPVNMTMNVMQNVWLKLKNK